MDSDSKGRIGEAFVDEITSRLGCRYRPQREKSYGVDGIIELGSGVWGGSGYHILVEVKTGAGNLASVKRHYSVRVDRAHSSYWLKSRYPVILVWVDDDRRKAFWTPIDRSSVSEGGTIVRVRKDSRYGLHSLGDLRHLCARAYGIEDTLPIVDPPDVLHLRVKGNKQEARDFYDHWRSTPFYSPAYGEVSITLQGWRHLTSANRPQRSIVRRLELLGAAHSILSTVPRKKTLREVQDANTIYYVQTAVVHHEYRADAVVSVVVKHKNGYTPTFYSVFEHRSRVRGGEAMKQSLLGAPAS